jgi:N4-gp56 family major capsid protein
VGYSCFCLAARIKKNLFCLKVLFLMSESFSIIKNAIDANAFISTTTSAGYVNPAYWNRQLLVFLEENLNVTQFAKVYDDILGQDGSSLNVTIDVTPTAAAAVAETTLVPISAQAHLQVIFTPTEYAKAYQLSDKQARRSWVDQMTNMTKKLGYALALGREQTAVTLLQGGAGNAVTVNNVVSSAIASSDVLNYNTIVNAAQKLMEDKLYPRALIVGDQGWAQLAKDPQFVNADKAGDNITFRQGRIGRIFGLDVYWTTLITTGSNKQKAILVGTDQMGEPCFGIARKHLPTIRTERNERGRFTDIVGVEEWDMKILRANGFCTLEHYAV